MTSKTVLDIEPSQWRHYRPFKIAADKNLTAAALAEATTVARSIAKELIDYKFRKRAFSIFKIFTKRLIYLSIICTRNKKNHIRR
jgi:hypothetical protein